MGSIWCGDKDMLSLALSHLLLCLIVVVHIVKPGYACFSEEKLFGGTRTFRSLIGPGFAVVAVMVHPMCFLVWIHPSNNDR